MSEDRDANGPPFSPPDRGGEDAWAARRDGLADRLAAKRAESRVAVEPDGQRAGGMRGLAQGLKVASEFIAGILVGAAIGYGIDSLFGTAPFGLIVFLLLGFVAGVMNVLRGVSSLKGSE